MAEVKTKRNNSSVKDFIRKVEDETKRKDSEKLLKMYTEITGEKAAMWGDSMIGFGLYHYKSERSSQEGDWPLAAFSPRKQQLTLYIMNGFEDYTKEIAKLGKCKTSKGCLYIKKLSDVDEKLLAELIKRSYITTKKYYNTV